MSTDVPGFQSLFLRFFASFCIGKTSVNNIKTTLPIIDNPKCCGKIIDYSNKFRINHHSISLCMLFIRSYMTP